MVFIKDPNINYSKVDEGSNYKIFSSFVTKQREKKTIEAQVVST